MSAGHGKVPKKARKPKAAPKPTAKQKAATEKAAAEFLSQFYEWGEDSVGGSKTIFGCFSEYLSGFPDAQAHLATIKLGALQEASTMLVHERHSKFQAPSDAVRANATALSEHLIQQVHTCCPCHPYCIAFAPAHATRSLQLFPYVSAGDARGISSR